MLNFQLYILFNFSALDSKTCKIKVRVEFKKKIKLKLFFRKSENRKFWKNSQVHYITCMPSPILNLQSPTLTILSTTIIQKFNFEMINQKQFNFSFIFPASMNRLLIWDYVKGLTILNKYIAGLLLKYPLQFVSV